MPRRTMFAMAAITFLALSSFAESTVLTSRGVGQCSAIGLTRRAAERERREEARQELKAREAQKAALEIRAYIVSKVDRSLSRSEFPGQPARRGRAISNEELVQASAHLGRVATAEVLAANTVLNVDAPRRYHIYDPEGHLVAETEATTSSAPRIAYEYIWFAGQPLAQINNATGEIHWYFNDHLGTPILQTDASARVVWGAEYEPYGAVYAFRQGEEQHQPLRFPGQESDGTSELSYNVFRHYRAEWGRYTQSDPMLRFSTRSELYLDYAYALLNPLRLVDPLGLFTVSGSCKKCESIDPKAKDLSTYIIDETSAWCKTKLGGITNVQLKKCITGQCTEGVVKCESDCEPGLYDKSPWAFSGKFGEWLAKKIYSPKTAVVCLNAEGNYLGEAGNTVIHEWAHGCGCDSDVPGNCQGIPGLPAGMSKKATP